MPYRGFTVAVAAVTVLLCVPATWAAAPDGGTADGVTVQGGGPGPANPPTESPDDHPDDHPSNHPDDGPDDRFEPGAAGAGDPYLPEAGNGGYRVGRYDLRLSYDPTTRRLVGTAVLDAVATQNLARFDLDLRPSLRVRSVLVDGLPASVRRSGQEVIVTPRVRPRSGWPFTVTVAYQGTPGPVVDPDGVSDGWIPTDDGAFVAGAPQGAPTWFPCDDHPGDKATFTVSMTVPNGIVAVGNGTLVSRSVHAGQTTFVWHTARPMAAHLATITLGRFQVSRSVTPSGIPVYLAVDPREAAAARPVLARLGEIVDYQRTVFGPYPFDTVGAIVDDAHFVGYALETQSRPVFDRAPSVAGLVHELAHQWFGASVSPARWQDVWLTEGFATYAEWLWSEHSGGPTARQLFDRAYAAPATDTHRWNPPPGDPGGPAHLFDGSVYQRGAMTLQVLRDRVGDDTFFRILRDWTSQHRYGTATTADLVALAERDSGLDLGPLFDSWLFQPGKPARG